MADGFTGRRVLVIGDADALPPLYVFAILDGVHKARPIDRLIADSGLPLEWAQSRELEAVDISAVSCRADSILAANRPHLAIAFPGDNALELAAIDAGLSVILARGPGERPGIMSGVGRAA